MIARETLDETISEIPAQLHAVCIPFVLDANPSARVSGFVLSNPLPGVWVGVDCSRSKLAHVYAFDYSARRLTVLTLLDFPDRKPRGRRAFARLSAPAHNSIQVGFKSTAVSDPETPPPFHLPHRFEQNTGNCPASYRVLD
jgi:hypothetical protein